MKSIDIIRLALKNFMRRKSRSILTIFGVVIGTASIVAMLSIGIAEGEMTKQQIDQMGNIRVITLYKPWDTSKGVYLDDDSMITFQGMEHVSAVIPQVTVWGKIAAGKMLLDAQIVGVPLDEFAKLGLDFEKGGFENPTGPKDIPLIFGGFSVYQFYNPRANPNDRWNNQVYPEVGQELPPAPVDIFEAKIKITGDYNYGNRMPGGNDPSIKKPKVYPARTTGLLKLAYDNNAYSVITDIEIVKKLKKEQDDMNNSQNGGGGGGGVIIDSSGMGMKIASGVGGGGGGGGKEPEQYEMASVLVDNIDHVQDVFDRIKEMGYEPSSPIEYVKAMQQRSASSRLLFAAIGAVAFFVAAIGIANTMVMAIYERTKEIGIMKVVGCKLANIRSLFLVEAAIIGFFGGLIGLMLSYGLSYGINNFQPIQQLITGGGGMMMGDGTQMKASIIPIWLSLVSIGFSTFVAILSGFLPARRAMKLSAIDAIRNDG